MAKIIAIVMGTAFFGPFLLVIFVLIIDMWKFAIAVIKEMFNG